MLPNIGLPELIIILVMALIIFGPGKLPEVGKSLGKTIREFRNSTKETVGGVSDTIKEAQEDLRETRETLDILKVEAPSKSTQS